MWFHCITEQFRTHVFLLVFTPWWPSFIKSLGTLTRDHASTWWSLDLYSVCLCFTICQKAKNKKNAENIEAMCYRWFLLPWWFFFTKSLGILIRGHASTWRSLDFYSVCLCLIKFQNTTNIKKKKNRNLVSSMIFTSLMAFLYKIFRNTHQRSCQHFEISWFV